MHPTTTTTVKARCRACGSNRVLSIFTGSADPAAAGMVIRECADCETRIGSYDVKTRPAWAKQED